MGVSFFETPRAINHVCQYLADRPNIRFPRYSHSPYRSLPNRLAPGSACSTFKALSGIRPGGRIAFTGRAARPRGYGYSLVTGSICDRTGNPLSNRTQPPLRDGAHRFPIGIDVQRRHSFQAHQTEQSMAFVTCLTRPSSTTRTRAFILADREIRRERRCLKMPGSSFLLAISDLIHRILR